MAAHHPLSFEDADILLFPRTWATLRQARDESVASAFVWGLYRAADNRSWVGAWGQNRYDGDAPSVGPRSVFDIASVTKVYATTALTALLVDRGWLSWETEVSSILPGFRHRGVQVRHLLSHTAGFVAWEPFWQKMRERFETEGLEKVSVSRRQAAMREMVLMIPLEARPGDRALYSDISFLLMGFALEELLGLPLDVAVERMLWNRLGVVDSRYIRVDRSASEARDPSIVATEDCPWRGTVIQGQVHDDNCWSMGGVAGHAGVFSSAPDLLLFSRSLLRGELLSQRVRNEMWQRVSPPLGCSRTLGWDTPSGEAPALGSYFSRRSVGHLGYTGTSLWIDPERGLAVTLLTNRVHPTRENTRIQELRRAFHRALAADLS